MDASSNAFLQQVTALMPTLRTFGRSLCGDATMAEDLVQDTVLKAWTHRANFQVTGNMKAWLLTILRNCYFSELRHRKFEIQDSDGKHAASIAVAPEHEAHTELLELSQALDTLREQQRQALLLVCGNGLSYEQAATACNCAVGTIKSRIARAREKLSLFLRLDEMPLRTPLAGFSSHSLASRGAQATP